VDESNKTPEELSLEVAEGVGEEVSKETVELDATDLDRVAGGATQNRYDAQVCPSKREADASCGGFFNIYWCDHFQETKVGPRTFRKKCTLGYFNYTVDITH